MARQFTDTKLIVASHNAGKVRELEELLSPYGAELVSAGDLGLPEPEETGTTFVANAELKALAAARATGTCSLGDDSGLAVSALNGDPGLYSARWAGPDRDFNLAMEKVWAGVCDSEDKSARFVCVLTLAWPDGHVESFEGFVDGSLVWPPRGTHGFGYDPMFVPDGHQRSFGEMPQAEKNPITHRADAFRKLIDGCFKQN
jgi:XTP/dITP diphosphohydrolase